MLVRACKENRHAVQAPLICRISGLLRGVLGWSYLALGLGITLPAVYMEIKIMQ